LIKDSSKEYRLLTEAEWEYAARADVGSLRVNDRLNAFGLYDMDGTLFEWVEDRWHDSYKDAPLDGSPWVEDGDAGRRVVRGGGALRAGIRFGLVSGQRNANVGFRLARTLTP
jgi:formylglycine-generating enzyme required for sulfatase activity